MTGFDFISLAIKLSNGAAEADLRTSVSRAYYGAFHVSTELLKECGVLLLRGTNPHDKIYFCLDSCAHPIAKAAGGNLHILRAIRNQADYNLESDRFTSARNVQRVLRIAHQVVDDIAACRQNLSTLRAEVRGHARRLGLTVVGEDR